ncbi:hypothetical protein [Mucilaginibacter segetis]|uniref:Uncharacterized protein n=1 Tax=Mucilaginibacter segetis TaxID=2793071 RepID=A0A934PR73_9SPHI|nr:hypothetical protein [Mucilaginibacter segetis]MBK0379278.1 hypothetical protein [Mucilaginibacter segetis]
MKKRQVIFLVLAAIYALLLAWSLGHNDIQLNPTDAPRYIGRHSLTKK